MLLNGFYVKDECVIYAYYDGSKKVAELEVDPTPQLSTSVDSISYMWTSKSMTHFSVPCSEDEFNAVCSRFVN